jgi:predicted NUDIX family NTP pyrophosphohydrolase
MKQSAGLLLWAKSQTGVTVLLVHPSGAYNRKAPFGIPKGEPDPDEPLEAAARRETREETGVDVTGPLEPLGHVDYKKSRKRIHAWSAPLPDGATPRCASWEIDQARMLDAAEAKRVIHPDQAAFVDRLLAQLAGRSGRREA